MFHSDAGVWPNRVDHANQHLARAEGESRKGGHEWAVALAALRARRCGAGELRARGPGGAAVRGRESCAWLSA
jgi:hypothetical protein